MSGDAFHLLGLEPDCDDDDQVRKAYHQLVRSGKVNATINSAYAQIRTTADRHRYRWTTATALLAPLPEITSSQPELNPLVTELVSLSDWELGSSDVR